MLQRCSPILHSPLVVKSENPYRFPVSIAHRCRKTSGSISVIGACRVEISEVQKPEEPTSSSSPFTTVYSSAPLIESGRRLTIRPTPELGLLYLLFSLSMAVGAIISLAIISIPTMAAIRRLMVSVELLSKVVSQEVPGTLLSLRLSSLELDDLTQQLSSLSNY